jgi:hypothetical protein
MEGDFFEVEHIKDRKWLFRVTNVEKDTLDNDNNVWKISWNLDRGGNEEILKNVVEEYEYLITPEGSNTKAVVQMTKFKLAQKTEEMASSLRSYFKDLFYSPYVQTFIYKWYNNSNMVDPFSVEFIRRNDLLTDSDNRYWYVHQQALLPQTFAIDYDKSIFRVFETKAKNKILTCQYQSQADFIDDKVSIFSTRYEPYFALNYKTYYFTQNTPFTPKDIIPILSEDIINHIATGELFTAENTDKPYLNVFVKWFNGAMINEKDLDCISCIDMQTTEEVYYHILFMIYVLDAYTRELLS